MKFRAATPAKMSDPPGTQLRTKRTLADVNDDSITPVDRKQLFDDIYHGEPSFNVNDELFTKKANELNILEIAKYEEYYKKLAKIESVTVAVKKNTARIKVFSDVGNIVDEPLLTRICNNLGPLLYDLADHNLDDEKKNDIIKVIKECTAQNLKAGDDLLKAFDLQQLQGNNALIPLDSRRFPILPSAMSGAVQISAAKKELNFLYPYPYEIVNHFPVFFCHQVFVDFVDILDDRRKGNLVVSEYKNFLNTEPDIKMKLDACIAHLISAILSFDKNEKEKDLVNGVVAALKKLFPSDKVKVDVEISPEEANLSSKVAMVAAIFIRSFPFVILEAKNTTYSLKAVLQALQYYGLTKSEFIDNDPCFLLTFDRGILYVYGVAKVNCRIVCSCLLSLEVTNYFFNVRKFTNTLFKCLGALQFFYNKFSARIASNSVDLQHIKYSSIKSAISYGNQPFPAIFSVKKEKNSQESVEISFEETKRDSIFKPGVYRVKTQEGTLAVLKIASSYNVEVHKKLALENLAPKLLGHQVFCNNFHVILMEYLDISVYDNIFNLFYNRKDSGIEINRERLEKSIEEILSKLEQLKIVHGDFRSNNIVAKRSEACPSVLEDFKLVDFEFSGFVNKPYPCLATKNPSIAWHDGFNSFSIRDHEHDKFMFKQMIETDFKGRIKKS